MRESQNNCQRLLDEIKCKENEHKRVTREKEELESKLHSAQLHTDAIRVDMNATLKDLADAHREISAFEQEKQSSQRLIDGLRSEISSKDHGEDIPYIPELRTHSSGSGLSSKYYQLPFTHIFLPLCLV